MNEEVVISLLLLIMMIIGILFAVETDNQETEIAKEIEIIEEHSCEDIGLTEHLLYEDGEIIDSRCSTYYEKANICITSE